MNTPMTTSKISKVLVAYTNSDSAKMLEDVLSLSARFKCVLVELGGILTDKSLSADVVVVDLQKVGDRELDMLADLRARYLSVPLIVISEALNESQMRRLFPLHVHDWLPKPLDNKLFHHSLQGAVVNTRSSSSQVHAIVAANGGAGATSISVSMAQILGKTKAKIKPSIAVFDLDFSAGDCSYVLNKPNAFGIDTVVENPSRVDAEFVNIIRQQHPDNFDIFSFKRPDLVLHPSSAELVLRMLDAVSMQHDHTILDVPYYETPWKQDVLAAVNSITVVAEMNLASLRHAKDLVSRIQKLRNDNYILNIAINKYESSWLGSAVKSKPLKDLFGDVNIETLSADAATMTEAFNRGLLPVEVNARSKFVRSLNKFLRKTQLTEVGG